MFKKDKRILGLVTIGQAPRTDLTPELKQFLGDTVGIIEAGALDGLNMQEVLQMYPGPKDYTLITKMSDDTQVKISKKSILPKLQSKIDLLINQGAQVITLACTGEFPKFECERLLVEPQKILFNTVKSLSGVVKLGVLIPDQSQVSQAILRWSTVNNNLIVLPASPYGCFDSKIQAAKKLKHAGVSVAVLDCIGYTLQDKQAIQKILEGSVILARSLVARVLSELL